MNISAVLLAGGESRRMGQDKATLIFQEKLLWQHQLEKLRKLKPTEIFISAREDPAWRPNDVQFVRDVPPSRGPLSGLAATLGRIQTTHLLALAIDVPFIPENFLVKSCEHVELGSGLVPMIGGAVEPLAGAIYPKEASMDFESALAGKDFSLRSVVSSLVCTERLILVNTTKEYERHFRNLNAPSDLDRLL